jgi:hypothetical protein
MQVAKIKSPTHSGKSHRTQIPISLSDFYSDLHLGATGGHQDSGISISIILLLTSEFRLLISLGRIQLQTAIKVGGRATAEKLNRSVASPDNA